MDLADFEKQLKEKDIFIIILPKKAYSDNIMKIVKIIDKNDKKVCYISANKPEKTITKMLKKNSIDSDKFTIVDCITENVQEDEKGKNIFLGSPTNFTGLNLAIKNSIDSGSEIIFIDAISTFMIYEQGIVVIRFAHNLITRLRGVEKKCIFIVMGGDVNRALIDDLDMFVDIVYE